MQQRVSRISLLLLAINYWHTLIFATVRTWKISKIPPKSARTELPGHIKISILTKCGVRVVYPETVTVLKGLSCARRSFNDDVTDPNAVNLVDPVGLELNAGGALVLSLAECELRNQERRMRCACAVDNAKGMCRHGCNRPGNARLAAIIGHSLARLQSSMQSPASDVPGGIVQSK